MALVLLSAGKAQADLTCIADTAVDDLAGSAQADLTQLCFDFDNLPTSYDVTVSFDKVRFTGANTGDACALFDSDGDANGFVDYAICFQVGGNPGTLLPGSPFGYQCLSPNSTVACGTASPVVLSLSSCTSATTSDDPFPTGEASPDDTKVSCTIFTSELPSNGSQVNACSYASASPTSDPKDCLLNIGGANIIIDKDADPDDSTSFAFNLTSPSTNESGSVTGDGTTFFNVTPGTYTITEAIPDNWGLTALSCVDKLGNSVGTVDVTTGSVSSLLVTPSGQVTCTFTNRKQADLTITKDDATTNYIPGATQIYSIQVINNGPANLAGAIVNDTIPDGLIIDSVTCNAGATCAISQTGQDITVTMDIDNGETVTISVQVTYSTDPAAY